jgi:hypothetical protein
MQVASARPAVLVNSVDRDRGASHEAGQTVHDPLESYVAFGTFAGFDPMLEQNDEWAVSRRYMSLEISLRSATIPLSGCPAWRPD